MLVNRSARDDDLQPNEWSDAARRSDCVKLSNLSAGDAHCSVIGQAEAVARILARVGTLATRRVSLLEAADCFSASDLHAKFSLPHFDNSAMDGYAVRSEDGIAGARLRVVGEQTAGLDRELKIEAGEALRIFTGAPIPAGADAVVMQEEVRIEEETIVLQTGVAPGEFVRRRGGDVATGQKILGAGDRIRSQMMALLAAQGLAKIDVGGEARVAIVATGDELLPPGAPLQRGEIYDGNSVMVEALVRKCGAKVAAVATCRDDEAEIEAAFRAGLEYDAMIVTGGVSVGARDFVKEALSATGATLDLWRVAVKPGKPFLFGSKGDCAIFGLPGNPVSAFVTFLLFVRPALLKMMGANDACLALPSAETELSDSLANQGDRPHYVRGIVREGMFTPMGRQESHALFGLSRSNALVLVPARENITAGTRVTAFFWE